MSQTPTPIKRIVIAGGGTGGHVYPAVAVAEEVLARNPGAKVVFVGSEKGLENKILPPLGYELQTITVSRLKGGGILERIKGMLRLPVGIFQSWRLLRRVKPQVVLGVGGYASGPVLLAAWMTFRRFAVQEQNAVPGMTNKFLGRIAHKVMVGFAAASKHFAKPDQVVVSGNPLRTKVTAALQGGSARPPGEPGHLRILIFGGSQGARFLNENVPAALAALHAKRPGLKLTVTHQTGPADETVTRERYAEMPFATVTSYIDDMPAAYAAADVAISRAGALTVAELTAVGLPPFMVPFPYAAYNHQVDNAAELVEAGAGAMMEQKDWQQERLVTWLETAADDRDALAAMSAEAHKLAKLEAAATVVDHLERIAKPVKNGAGNHASAKPQEANG